MPVRSNAGKWSTALVTLVLSSGVVLGVGSFGGLAGAAQAATPPVAPAAKATAKATPDADHASPG